MSKPPTQRLLIVGSNPRNLELLERFLAGLGYATVRTATMEVLDQTLDQNDKLDLALVDITGFDQSIWSRCARLHTANIPLLIISPRQSAAIQQESALHGAHGLLVKPLVMRELSTLIQRLLDKSQGFDDEHDSPASGQQD